MKIFSINKIWSAIFTLFFGIILLLRPTSTLDIVATIAALVILIIGAFTELDVLHHGADTSPVNHLPGLILCIIALLMFTFKQSIISIIPLLFGIFILISCLSKFQDASIIKKAGGNQTIPMILAALGIIIGLLIVFNPFKSIVLLLRIVGIGLVYSGLSDIILWIRIKRRYS
ncbi:DUF308 domain-containing protein [Falcatimonas sp. MSJ-15]|uniref:HdeD family acid-resistance protein n=1 Tax=Falcatimonas sp. MSJ-15 TaxID=2841515 RepID=UPI001C1222B2|nr:DUF308 domain-containing protein [Falcatimonas sp. MSJ-15]MBU5470261.1 DUF308 domain-containing protein [Falcatimonas sp. MSJ-15]